MPAGQLDYMVLEQLNLIDDFFTQFVGEFYADVATSAVIIILAFLVAKLFNFILKRFVLHVSSKTKTDLDDMVVEAISLPILLAIVVAGIFISLQGLPFLADYSETVNAGFTVFYILFAALIAIRIINVMIYWYAKNQADKTSSKLDDHFLPSIRRLVMLVVILFALTAILGAFGVELTAMIATLGVGGIAIALALQDTLKEFFAGGQVILDKPIKIGDLIQLDSGDRGTVVDIGWRSTVISTWDGNYVTLPNSMIANSKLINYSQPKKEVAFTVPGGVGYHEDLDKVEKVIMDVAKKTLKKMGTGIEGKEPLVRFKEFGDSNINFVVVFRVKSFGDQHVLKHEFIKALKKRFDREGIEISWPVRKVYEHKGKGK